MVKQYSAVWLNSAVWFCINSAVSLKFRPFGFVLIRLSGFGQMDKFNILQSNSNFCWSGFCCANFGTQTQLLSFAAAIVQL